MFELPKSQNIVVLHGTYSISIVILSIAIACCASFTALSLNQRIQQNSFFHRMFWLFLASVAMGLGIWSMHFIGMSAFLLPIPMKFDLFLTMISMVPAILASYLAFYIANRTNKTHWPYLISGIIMGLGISSMHYVGMAAMKMKAEYVYKPWIFSASIVIAVIVSYAAMYIFSTLQKFMGNYLIKGGSALLMGLAITSMHYTGMASVIFYVRGSFNDPIHQMHPMNMAVLILVVTIGIFILLLLSGLTSLLDRYVDNRLRYFDALTLLPNQRQFEKDLEKTGLIQCMAVIHLHNLEKWISGHGYQFGDYIIESASELIQMLTPAFAKVYRIEGNRFAVFSMEDHSIGNMASALERMMSALSKPIAAGEKKIIIDAVCAISYAYEKKDGSMLFSNSMAVLQHPTINYNHEVIEYDPAVHTYSFERQLVQDIERAITADELFIVYQPKICTHTKSLSGVEALVRWNHPDHGMISPGIFIPVLEENGKIFELTDWVIHKVCWQISRWTIEGMPLNQVSINIPGSYVTSPRLLDVLNLNLLKYKIPNGCLELEITETSVIHDIENAITAVGVFREMGLAVALDDFGTGLSSLSYLKRIPITTIKIDKSFVDGVPQSEKDSAVLKAIVTLCRSLNLNVVIEGAETREQIEFITRISETTYIQGYFYSRPLKEKDLIEWMNKRNMTASL